ncbi:MAG: nucleotide exchange factor GrpE [Deltaproteobacteria bacterium]|nr:nucleotide exchange factor GrpE [Deltaproteobacteria bacterium]
MSEKEKKVEQEEEQIVEEDKCEEGQLVLTDKEQAEQYLANWQRAQADFANFKKRTEQERAEFVKFANSALMSSLLPVIDDFERALENASEQIDSGWIEGIELIYRKLLAGLESQGLLKIEAGGQDFDPNFHQAVLYEEGDEGKVIEELQKGYMLHDRLLRPTMVKVGKGNSDTSKEDK